MMSEHWPRGTLVTRLYERDSLALSLIRSSGETRAHRSPSARPAFLTVRRLLYSNESFLSFSSAEFCSAYLTPEPLINPARSGRHPAVLPSAASHHRPKAPSSHDPTTRTPPLLTLESPKFSRKNLQLLTLESPSACHTSRARPFGTPLPMLQYSKTITSGAK